MIKEVLVKRCDSTPKTHPRHLTRLRATSPKQYNFITKIAIVVCFLSKVFTPLLTTSSRL